MKHLLNVWMAALLLTGVAGCEYDDEALWNKVNELEEQVDQNSQTIATLQQLIDALNQGKVIMSVEQTAAQLPQHLPRARCILATDRPFRSTTERMAPTVRMAPTETPTSNQSR